MQRKPAPLNLHFLLGHGGDKYIVGGILLRRTEGWQVAGQQLTYLEERKQDKEELAIGEARGDLSEISAKVASLDVRGSALLRNKIDGLVVPLACIVNYFGIRFEAISLIPVSLNSLAYGSDTEGLLVETRDYEAEIMAEKIGSLLNLKPHVITEKS